MPKLEETITSVILFDNGAKLYLTDQMRKSIVPYLGPSGWSLGAADPMVMTKEIMMKNKEFPSLVGILNTKSEEDPTQDLFEALNEILD